MDGNLCFKEKTGENISFENGVYFKGLDFGRQPNHVSMTKPAKIFRLKMTEGYKTRDFDYMVFGHFKNVHFAVCASSILHAKFKTPKNGFVTIMLSKRIFNPKNL